MGANASVKPSPVRTRMNVGAGREFSYFQLSGGVLRVEFKNPWNYVLESRSSCATSRASARVSSSTVEWRCLLDKVRAFFEENPTEI